MQNLNPHIIGISGKTGAGKSTLAKILSLELNATLISWDNFDDISVGPEDFVDWYNRGGNYSEFQREELEKILAKLKAGKNAIHPVLQKKLIPTKYIIFDAPLGRLHKQTGKYIDTWIHIEVPLDVSLCRRVLRDLDDESKTKEDILEEISFYLNHSRPLFFDHDLKQNANVVVDGLLPPEIQIRIIKDYLNGEKMTQPKLDTYLSLCTQVYDLSKPKPPEDAYAFYRDYVKKTKGPILEPMCGTGRFLLPLLEEGFNVQGFDASEHMLEALYAKASAKSLKPMVWKGFVEELKRPEKYDLIFIPSGSFCLIIDLAAVKLALQALYNHLNDDGVFLFECETIKAVPQTGTWYGSVWYKPDGKMIVLSQLAFFEDNICNSIGKYELVHNNYVIHTEIEELKIRIHDPNELTEMLKSCGFKSIRTIKAFNSRAIPDEHDESIVYECRK